MSPWDEKYGQALIDALKKLPLEDLVKLTEMFDCKPPYDLRDEAGWYPGELHRKFMWLRDEAEAAKEMRGAIAVLDKYKPFRQ